MKGIVQALLLNLMIAFAPVALAADLNMSSLAPVKLLNPKTGTCGSGFISGSLIITNFHLAESLCASQECKDVKVYPARNSSQALDLVALKRGISAPAYDLATFEISENLDRNAGAELPIPSAQELVGAAHFSEIVSFSFPSCGDLIISEGALIGIDSRIHSSTSLRLKHGSSGAVVFNAKGELQGVVCEAESFSSALVSKIFGFSFSSTRIVPVERLEELLNLAPETLYLSQVSALNDFYSTVVLKSASLHRLEESSRFLSRIKNLADQQLKVRSGAATLLIALEQSPYPRFLDWPSGINALEVDEVLLAFAASVEQTGLNASFSKPLNSSQVEELQTELLAKFPAQQLKINRLFLSLKQHPPPGINELGLKLALPYLFSILALLIIYTFAVGVCIAQRQRSCRHKIGIFAVLTLIFGLLLVIELSSLLF